MTLGSDYDILVMTRMREQAYKGSLSWAVTRAIGTAGGTNNPAGPILAGSVLVRTLLIRFLAVLLRRWNWWPSRLADGLEALRYAA